MEQCIAIIALCVTSLFVERSGGDITSNTSEGTRYFIILVALCMNESYWIPLL